MGRWSYSYRIEADYLKKVSIFDFKKMGLFFYQSYKEDSIYWENNDSVGISVCTMVGNEFVIFHYFVVKDNEDGKAKEVNQRFSLVTTSCNFGGLRYWFECWNCKRRVGVLYLKDGFACRHCYDLAYESRKLSGRFKAYGNIISAQEVDEARKAVKRGYYNGKMTRKLERYLKKAWKFKRAYAGHIGVLSTRWWRDGSDEGEKLEMIAEEYGRRLKTLAHKKKK